MQNLDRDSCISEIDLEELFLYLGFQRLKDLNLCKDGEKISRRHSDKGIDE